MSEIGIISQEYKNTAGLFQKINQAVILLKKDFYRKNAVDPETINDAKFLLSNVLGNILMQLNDSLVDIVFDEELVSIPPFFIKRLQEHRQGDLEWYIEELKELQLKLKENSLLDENSLNTLDEICGQLDAETSKLYRKMRRR